MGNDVEFDAIRGHLFWPSLALAMLLIFWLTNSTITASLLLLPIVMILVQAVVSARILATNPADCWRENELR